MFDALREEGTQLVLTNETVAHYAPEQYTALGKGGRPTARPVETVAGQFLQLARLCLLQRHTRTWTEKALIPDLLLKVLLTGNEKLVASMRSKCLEPVNEKIIIDQPQGVVQHAMEGALQDPERASPPATVRRYTASWFTRLARTSAAGSKRLHQQVCH